MDFALGTIHRAGFKHRAADVLSKVPTNVSDCTVIEIEIAVTVFTQLNRQALNFLRGVTAVGSHAEAISTIESDPPKLLLFIKSQRTDTYCNKLGKYVGLPDPTFT